MTRAKATHMGTCQCCGSKQKLPGGKLALHGYEVARFGFFNGVCGGARHEPFEVSKDLIEQFIARAQAQKEVVRADIEAARDEARRASDESRECWYHVYHRELSSRTRGSVFLWVRVKLIVGGESQTGGRQYVTHFQADGREPESVSYSEIPRFIRENNGHYIKDREKTLQDIDDYIVWQRGRIEGWAPRALTPVDGDAESVEPEASESNKMERMST